MPRPGRARRSAHPSRWGIPKGLRRTAPQSSETRAAENSRNRRANDVPKYPASQQAAFQAEIRRRRPWVHTCVAPFLGIRMLMIPAGSQRRGMRPTMHRPHVKRFPTVDDPRLYHGPDVPWYVMLAEGKFKYVRNLIPGETEELYNLEKDPEELENLAFKKLYQRRLREMRDATVQELKRTHAGFADHLPKTKSLK